MDQKPVRSKMTKLVYFLCAFHGICAVIFGGSMMLFPVDNPFGLGAILPEMGNFPFQMFFQTLFWSGLALLLCNGVCNLIAAGLFFKRQDATALIFALLGGILLIIWDTYELLFLPNPAAVLYLLFGVVQTVLCYLLIRKKSMLTSMSL